MKRILELLLIISMLGVLRITMYGMHNFTPIGAIALFGGAVFAQKRLAYLIPLGALVISDLIMGIIFGAGYMDYLTSWYILFPYAGFVLMVLIGNKLIGNKRGWTNILGASIVGSVAFFLITNFGSWLWDPMYPKTFEGLTASYLAGLAFFQNTFFGNFALNGLMSTVFFTVLSFGALWVMEKYWNRRLVHEKA